ncbi:hypothetical protein JDV02_005465 [Purpureocillium takamizusanense]|uniref:RRM domain-containing protein n=1 Tax=Purpureocillium takamizusanense TaxID=2060973 RepID=A0A9Q8QHG7_9HYPO|nr:uncharacterized protein JDV02_005465 [Purpureocillium takamizusanense]UNI19271.1 hypothetical protein JDV02_005465 [Purpureocillium takamizusanense]
MERRQDQGSKNRKGLVVDTSGLFAAGPASSEGSSARFTPSPYDLRYFPRGERPRTPTQYHDDVAFNSANGTAATQVHDLTRGDLTESFPPSNESAWPQVHLVPRDLARLNQQLADSTYGSYESPISRKYGHIGSSFLQHEPSLATLDKATDDLGRAIQSPPYDLKQRQEPPFSTSVFTTMEPIHTATTSSPLAAPFWHQRSTSVPRIGPSSLPTGLSSAMQNSWAAGDPFSSPRMRKSGASSLDPSIVENGGESQSYIEDPGQQGAFDMQQLRVALPVLPEYQQAQGRNSKRHHLSHSLSRLSKESSFPKVSRSASATHPAPVPAVPTAYPSRGSRSLSVPGFTPMRACLTATEDENAHGQSVARSLPSSQACCSSKFSVRYKGMHTTKNASNDTLPDRLNCSIWITNLPQDITYAELLESVGSRGRIFCSFINSPDGVKFHTAAAKVVFFKPGPAQRLRDEAAHPGFYVRGHRTRITLNRIKSSEVPVAGRNCRVLIITGRDDFVNEQTLREWFDRRIVWQGDGVIELIHARGRTVLEWRFGSYRNQAEMAKLALEKDRPVGLEHVEFGFDPNEVGADDMSSYAIAAERIQGKY